MEIGEIEARRFRRRLMGFDPGDVEPYLRALTDELYRLKAENESFQRDVHNLDLALKEHREREKTIRAVLVSAQKSAEQVKTNAERQARLIVSEAEVKAEGILKEASNRLIRMEQEMSELRRNRVQFGARMRSLLDSFRQILDDDSKQAPLKNEEKPDSPEPI